MSDGTNGTTVVESKPPMWLAGVAVGGLVLGLGALAWSFSLQSHLTTTQQNLDAANKQNAVLSEKIQDTNERMRAQGQALAQN